MNKNLSHVVILGLGILITTGPGFTELGASQKQYIAPATPHVKQTPQQIHNSKPDAKHLQHQQKATAQKYTNTEKDQIDQKKQTSAPQQRWKQQDKTQKAEAKELHQKKDTVTKTAPAKQKDASISKQQAQQKAAAQKQYTNEKQTKPAPGIRKDQNKTAPKEAGHLDQSTRDRIEVLRGMLKNANNSDGIDLDGNPHAARLQDPKAIAAAIEELKNGEDICTRCLMACGAAD